MNEYIKKSEAVDVIVKYPYEIAGKTATAIKMIEDLPSADVVLRAELAVRSFKDANTIANLQRQNAKLTALVKALITSTSTHKEEEAYNKGYTDAKADLLEKLQADIARDEVLAEYGDELFEGRIAGFKAVINYLNAEGEE